MKSKKILIIAVIAAVLVCGVGMKVYHDKKIEAMQTAAIAQITEAAPESSYTEEHFSEVEAITEEAAAAISALKDQETVDAAVEEALAKISEIPTNADIEKIRSAAVEEVGSIVDLKDYREEQQKEIGKLIDTATEEIAGYETTEDMSRIIENVTAKIKEIKTDSELTAEEQAARSYSRSGSSSGGCVGSGASNFY